MAVEIFKQMRGIAERNRQVKFDVERISGQLIGVDESNPDTISIGTPVKLSFIETELTGETRIDLGFEPV